MQFLLISIGAIGLAVVFPPIIFLYIIAVGLAWGSK
jgi:hypothetical protein